MKTLIWKVNITRPIPCPDNKPDPYTGQYSGISCLVDHCETVTESKIKEFETLEQVRDFISHAPGNCYDFKINGELTPTSNTNNKQTC